MQCLRGGAVFVLASAGQSPWPGSRGAELAVFRSVPCSAAPAVCASLFQGGCRRSGCFGLVARRPLVWYGSSLPPPPSLPPQAFCDLVPWFLTFSEAMRIGAGVTIVPQPHAL